MLGIQNYGSFIMAIIVFQIIPGAGTVSILNATAKKGVGSGMKAVFGTLFGDFIYMLAAVLGLAAMLSAYPVILNAAQWFGVLYLCYLGWRHLRSSLKNQNQTAGMTAGQASWAFFRQALAVSLTNPKVILFFMAFFPLFLNADSSPTTLFILMAHVTVISFAYQTILVLAGNAVARRLSQWQYARAVATRLAGIALIGFGVKLALSKK